VIQSSKEEEETEAGATAGQRAATAEDMLVMSSERRVEMVEVGVLGVL
jgi:hypothetical protein